jgi:hypothetical protein
MTMLTGKPNKMWVTQLDGLELPAGSSFDKKAAWAKLHQRLHQKQQKKGFIWWAASAAAVVLLLIYLFTGTQDSRNITPIHATIAVRQMPTLIIHQPSPAVTSSSPVVVSPAKNTNDHIAVPRIINADSSVTDAPIIASNMPDTAITTVAVAKKKKMAVVHNNELEPAVLTLPTRKTTTSTAELLAEYRKHQDLILELTDTLNPTKPRKKLLPFSSLISQKQ